ncbi:MAG: pitrilysin family protein [Solirubrobacteraceae bacterium]|jgi:predicted Zn-dependent peptidase
MDSAHVITELDGGVRVVTERVPAVRSVAFGFWIGTGSVTESEEQAGLSHLLEHMLFRGTARYASEEIDQIFDAMGAELNAGTAKETTSVYARVLDIHLERAFDVIAQMISEPAVSGLAEEREVVLEEIAMYEDDPQDLIFDVLGEAVFPGHPLGRAILGRSEVVAGATREQLLAFHHERYFPQNIVIAAAGSVEHDQVVAWAEAALSKVSAPQRDLSWPADPPPGGPRTVFKNKDTEQYHVCFGGVGLARNDERRFALRVLDSLTGGNASSRLFQAVREQRGLAYAVFTFQALYAHTGQAGLYVGTRADNLVEVVRVIADELARLRAETASEEEIARAKDNVKGRAVLAMESTTARMERLGGSVLAEMPILEIDEMIERIDAVDGEQVRTLAAELFDPEHLCAAAIGPDEGLFRGAVEPLLANAVRAS